MFEQERTLSRLQQTIQRDYALFACFLVGSFGRRDQNPLSDINLFLVYPSAAAAELAWRRRGELAEMVQPYVAAKWWDHPTEANRCAILFANGSLLDVSYAERDGLQPAPIFRQVTILKDGEGWAADLTRRSAAAVELPPPPLNARDLEQLDNRFWIGLWQVWRRVAQGNVDAAFSFYLDLVGDVLPVLLAHLPAGEPAASPLAELIYTHDAGQTGRQLRRLAQAYQEARGALIGRYRLAYQPDAGFERELLQRMGSGQ